MNEPGERAKSNTAARNLLPVILALLLGASLTTNVFLMLQPAANAEVSPEEAPCEGFWCSLTTWG
jgi:hypothetical protein